MARRKRVKRLGKNLIRGLGDFLGRQSMVGDAPVLDSKHFTFLKSFTDDWQTIRAELTEILKHREAIPLFQDVSSDQKKISLKSCDQDFRLLQSRFVLGGHHGRRIVMDLTVGETQGGVDQPGSLGFPVDGSVFTETT